MAIKAYLRYNVLQRFRQKRQQGLNNGRLTSTMTGYVKIVPNTDNGRSQCLLYRKRHASNEVTLNLCPST